MASVASSIVLLPFLFIFHAGLAAIPLAVWGLIVATGAAQGLYYIFLAGAYRSGELSLGYPLARSLPVVLVALASLALGRGGQIQVMAYVGFVAVAAGCLILPLPRFNDFHIRHYRHKWVIFAFLAAVCITALHIDRRPGPPNSAFISGNAALQFCAGCFCMVNWKGSAFRSF